MKKRVLITGHGAPGTPGTVLCLSRSRYYKKCEILFSDASQISKETIALPHGSNDNYKEEFTRAIVENKIDYTLPQTEAELKPLSLLNTGRLYKSVAISSPFSVFVASNKAELLSNAQAIGVPTPKMFGGTIKTKAELIKAIKDAGYPETSVVIKPIHSSGSRGLRILSNSKDAKRRDFFTAKPETVVTSMENVLEQYDIGERLDQEMIVQEHIPGEEWSVDCYRDPISLEIIAVPRRRDTIINGISKTTTVVKNTDLEMMSMRLANRLDLKYCFGFQFKYDRFGIPRLLECNPRIQGTMVASMFAGVNIPGMALESLITQKPVQIERNIRYNTKTTRIWSFMSESQ